VRIAGNSVTAIDVPETRIGMFPGWAVPSVHPVSLVRPKRFSTSYGAKLTEQRAYDIEIVHEAIVNEDSFGLKRARREPVEIQKL
jgi:enoyl-CoA hydratase/carnithine racemase